MFKKDIIRYDNRLIKLNKKTVTILLNKPLGVITTVKDTHNRRTVMLWKVSTRVFPIGRLDKDSTGAILLTNDGELHQYLSHPKNKVFKDYEVVIEDSLTNTHKDKLKGYLYWLWRVWQCTSIESGKIKKTIENCFKA